MAKKYITETIDLDFDRLNGDLDKVTEYLQSSVRDEWRNQGITPRLTIDVECDSWGWANGRAFLQVVRPETKEEGAARRKAEKARASMIREAEITRAKEVLAKYGEP